MALPVYHNSHSEGLSVYSYAQHLARSNHYSLGKCGIVLVWNNKKQWRRGYAGPPVAQMGIVSFQTFLGMSKMCMASFIPSISGHWVDQRSCHCQASVATGGRQSIRSIGTAVLTRRNRIHMTICIAREINEKETEAIPIFIPSWLFSSCCWNRSTRKQFSDSHELLSIRPLVLALLHTWKNLFFCSHPTKLKCPLCVKN